MTRILTTLTLLFASTTVLAQDFDYTYLQGGYVRYETEISGFDLDGNGWVAGGSAAIADNFHIFGSFSQADLDDFDVTVDTWEAGIGFNTSIMDGVDLVVDAAYVNADIGAGGFGSLDDDGFGASVGLRIWVTETVELDVGASWVNFDDGGDDTGLGASVLFMLTDELALILGGSWNDDSETSAYTLGLRFNLGY